MVYRRAFKWLYHDFWAHVCTIKVRGLSGWRSPCPEQEPASSVETVEAASCWLAAPSWHLRGQVGRYCALWVFMYIFVYLHLYMCIYIYIYTSISVPLYGYIHGLTSASRGLKDGHKLPKVPSCGGIRFLWACRKTDCSSCFRCAHFSCYLNQPEPTLL